MSIQSYQIYWEKQYQRLLRKFLKKNAVFNGSQVCAWMRAQGLQDPPHSNLWGAQISYYAGQGWYKKIGSVRPASQHAHIQQVAVWQRA